MAEKLVKKRSRDDLEPSRHEQRYASGTSTEYFTESRGIEETAFKILSKHNIAKNKSELAKQKWPKKQICILL